MVSMSFMPELTQVETWSTSPIVRLNFKEIFNFNKGRKNGNFK